MWRALAGAFAAWALLASPEIGHAGAQEEPAGERERAELSALVGRDQPIEIEADELVYEQERDVYEATGNVVIRQPDGATLEADWITFNATTRIGVASGNVVIRQGDDVVRSQFATVDLRRTVAMATHATVDTPDPGFVFDGETVRKTGVNTYSLDRAVFTTCRCRPDGSRRPWQIEAQRADVHVGGYAIARDVTFRALGLPLLYSPWLALPVKTERQSGLLIPSFEASSRNGAAAKLPFFWAAADPVNVLLRPSFYSARGFSGYGETEYLFGERGFGRAGGSFLPEDKEVRNNRNEMVRPADPNLPYDPKTPFSEHRWGMFARHEQPLTQTTRLGTDVTLVSDNDYVLDFDDVGSRYRNSRFVEAMGYAAYAHGNRYADLEISLNNDVQSPQDLDRDRITLQRMPDIRVARLPDRVPRLAEALPWLPLQLSFETRYTYFYQPDYGTILASAFPTLVPATPTGNRTASGAAAAQFFDTGPDGIFDADETGPTLPAGSTNPANIFDRHRDSILGRGELDGIFQEGELLADHGHRIEFSPRLAVPARLGILEMLGEVGVREALYQADLAGGDSRTAYTGRLDSRTRFGRRFQLGQARLDHLVEPGVAFAVLRTANNAQNPLFIPEPHVRPRRLIDGDLRNLLRDPSDRLEDQALLIASLGNRLFTRSGVSGISRMLAELRLSGGYDFERRGAANFFLDTNVNPWRSLVLRGQLGYNPRGEGLEEALAAVSWRGETDHRLTPVDPERRHEVSLAYRYLRDLPPFFDAFRRSDKVFDDFQLGFDRVAQLSLEGRFAVARLFDVFGAGYTSFEDSDLSGGTIGVITHSECACWRVRAELDRSVRPEEITFRLRLELAGFGL
jgi:lipopolysaccharide assembly outer membrane protein LptD (OstA)